MNRRRDTLVESITATSHDALEGAIAASWKRVAPFWPLGDLVGVNPLRGWEDLPFEEALIEGKIFYQQSNVPKEIEEANRHTMKWCQGFFDRGQARIPLPLRAKGFYTMWRRLALFDATLHRNEHEKIVFLRNLPEGPQEAIGLIAKKLRIPPARYADFFLLLLTTLPGWASHVAYCNESSQERFYPVSQAAYLAVRMGLVALCWPQAARLLEWYDSVRKEVTQKASLPFSMYQAEETYRRPLIESITRRMQEAPKKREAAEAQWIFCIDVRSEPVRRILESNGLYETFGFAGFFGLPIEISDSIHEESYSSCPVLIQPKHAIVRTYSESKKKIRDQWINRLKCAYFSLKYSFPGPFILVDFLGPFMGIWMTLRSLFPTLAAYCKNLGSGSRETVSMEAIPFQERCDYAEAGLRMIGLTENFAPVIVVTGHGSTTENNPFDSSLHCGACGGKKGGMNAAIFARILNDSAVRHQLEKRGIVIPHTTRFIGAEHDTSTDSIRLDTDETLSPCQREILARVKKTLREVQKIVIKRRANELEPGVPENKAISRLKRRARDWSEVQPEWGLAKNGAFIVGPRSLSEKIDLQGRVFLHSYAWEKDDGSHLRKILTGPLVVGQWINSQYLFSSLDPVAFGAGSKITKNITGKMGIMQGNASDYMHGLPWQSTYRNSDETYHEPIRLLVIISAPKGWIEKIIRQEKTLENCFRNGWMTLVCLDPIEKSVYSLQRTLEWRK